MSSNTVPREMVFEAFRYKTFKNWPYDDNVKCNPKKMAEAGFYFSGGIAEPDLAVCYLCKKEMDGWDETDDPWTEHRDHAPQCMFVQLNKPEEEMTIEQFLGLCYQFNLNKLKSTNENYNKKFNADVELLKISISKGK